VEQVDMRYNFSESRRKEKLTAVINQRQEIINEEEAPLTARSNYDAFEWNAEDDNAILEMEKGLLENLKKRQREEIETMIELELRNMEMQKDHEYRLQKFQNREVERKKEILKKHRDEMEKRHRIEIEKLEQEKIIRDKKREMMQRKNLEEQRLVDMEQERQTVRKREARERDLQIQKTAEARRRRMEEMQSMNEILRSEKLKSMEEKERRRKEMIEMYSKQRSVQMEEKMVKNKVKLQAVLEQNVEIMKEQQREFQERQQKSSKKRELFERERNRQLKQKKLVEENKEKQREEVKQRMVLEHERKVEEIKRKKILAEENIQKTRDQKYKEIEIGNEERRLKQLEKLENVERIKRMDDFRRKQKLEKIKLDDERMVRLRIARGKAIAHRNMIRSMATLQREKIHQVMDKMRTTKKLDIPELSELLGADITEVVEQIRKRTQSPPKEGNPIQSLSPNSARRAHSAGRFAKVSTSQNGEAKENVNNLNHTLEREKPRAKRPRSTGKFGGTFSNYNISSQPVSSARKSAADALQQMYQCYNEGVPPSPNKLNPKHIPPISKRPAQPRTAPHNEYRELKLDSPLSKSLASQHQIEEQVSPVNNEYYADEDDTIYNFRQKQNNELLAMMSEERQRDIKRSEILARTRTEQQKQYLMQRFQQEREEANARIMQLAESQDNNLANKLRDRSASDSIEVYET
jgi:hypothetical protein